jgi:hypothetical protein
MFSLYLANPVLSIPGRLTGGNCFVSLTLSTPDNKLIYFPSCHVAALTICNAPQRKGKLKGKQEVAENKHASVLAIRRKLKFGKNIFNENKYFFMFVL